MSFPVYLRGFSLFSLRWKIVVLIVVELQSAFFATATIEVPSDAGSEGICARGQNLQPSPIQGNQPCKAALMQKIASLAPSNTAQREGEDVSASDGGGPSQVQQAMARRDRALLRAKQARSVAQKARERRQKLEAARDHRLQAHVQKEGTAADVRHLRKKIWNNLKEVRNGNPMVTMVFLLMSVPAGVVLASLSILLYVKWGERNVAAKLGRPTRPSPFRRGK